MIEIIGVIVASLVSGGFIGYALSNHTYMVGYHDGYMEALDYIDSQTVLVLDKSGKAKPLTEEEVTEMLRRNS